MESKIDSESPKRFNRFNQTYENPYNIFNKYLNGTTTLYDIGQKCKKGNLNPEIRSTIYKIFLNILPYNNPGSWKKILQEKREIYYNKLNTLYSKNEYIKKFIECHALKSSKPYLEIYENLPEGDNELLSLIKLDIDRTFQDMDLFRNNKIKELLTKILYVNSIDNPDPSYCQGMNEILGTLFYAFLPSLKYDKFSKEEHENENNNNISNVEMLYSFIVCDEHFEADLFWVYSELMNRDLTLLYTYNSEKYRYKNNNVKYDLQNLKIEDLYQSEESDLLKRIKKIFYIDLKKIDEKFFDILFGNIEPNLFLLRWILCILDREISLKNIFRIWDCILFYEFVEFTLEGKETNNDENNIHVSRLNFLDFVCVAMILSLKRDIINSEPSVILCKFLKFPNEKHIKTIISETFKLAEDFNGNIDMWENEKLKIASFI